MKYDFDMDYTRFSNLHKPALFLAMQYQSGVQFQDSYSTEVYNFHSSNPCSKNRLVGFVPRRKSLTGLPTFTDPHHPQIPEDERLAYHLARHFRSLGPRSKLGKSDSSSLELSKVAAHYNLTGRFEEGKRYATAAASAANRNSGTLAIALSQLIEALGGLQINPNHGPDEGILTSYRQALNIMSWHWGATHPWLMGIHDRVSTAYLKAKKFQQSLEFHTESLNIALSALGKTHGVTASYLAKNGVILSHLNQTEECIASLNSALHILNSLPATPSLIAEVHSYLAQAMNARGDLDAAIAHAQKCKKLREQAHGQADMRSVASYMLLAALVMKPYESYNGVLTPAIRAAYREAISCYEKVFRFLKAVRPNPDTSGKWMGSTGSSVLGSSKAGSSSASVMSFGSSVYYAGGKPRSNMSEAGGSKKESNNGMPPVISPPIGGPALVPPFAPLPPLPRKLLHKLTKQIVSLKLALLESPKHKEIVRTIRQASAERAGNAAAASAAEGRDGPGAHGGHIFAFDENRAREVVINIAAISPATYINELLSRIDDDDESAIDELAIAMQLTEKESVGLVA
jgi:tetratricopeptide (TPR) repeat protein